MLVVVKVGGWVFQALYWCDSYGLDCGDRLFWSIRQAVQHRTTLLGQLGQLSSGQEMNDRRGHLGMGERECVLGLSLIHI